MIALRELIRDIPSIRFLDEPIDPALQVNTVRSDSRLIKPGDVFIALKGERVDGHDHIDEALARGCTALIIENDNKLLSPSRCPVLVTEDTHYALGLISAALYAHPARSLQLIAITGTNGKTTTSSILEDILIRAGLRPGVIGTIDSHYLDVEGNTKSLPSALTTPDSLTLHRLLRLMVDSGVTHVIMEASSHALVQQRLAGLEFQVAVFTNLSRDHLDYHGSMEEYFQAKTLLFTKHLSKDGYAVICGRSDTNEASPSYAGRLERILSAASVSPERIITCGFDTSYDLHTIEQATSRDGSSMEVIWRGKHHRASAPLIGRHNILNLLTACSAAIGLSLEPPAVFQALSHVKQVPGRLEKVCLPGRHAAPYSPLVVVDYAHTPDALENVLRTLREITTGRLICVFGCGGDRDRGKRRPMGKVSGNLADVSIATSDNPRGEEPHAILLEVEKGLLESGAKQIEIADLATTGDNPVYMIIQDRRNAIVTACSTAGSKDVILIAGKGHETYQLFGDTKHFFDDRLEALNGLMTWNMEHLLRATGGQINHGGQSGVLGDIVTDSRTIRAPQIFLALRGEKFDGHDFLGEVVAKGTKVLISEVAFNPGREDVMVLQVPDTLRALGDLAAYRRSLLGESLRVVGITGSCGKTTVKEMTAAILGESYSRDPGHPDPILKTAGNFNNLIGLPLTLLGLKAHHRIAVLEMGMNRAGEIRRLTEIADPDVGCITNVHAAHLEGLGDINGVAAAKGELFVHMRPEACRVINLDEPHIVKFTGVEYRSPKICFAQDGTSHQLRPEISAEKIQNHGPAGLDFELHYGEHNAMISLSVGGTHNLANSLAAAAICFALSIPVSSVAQGLKAFSPIDKRMQLIELPGSIIVLNDCYNANPGSMRAALTTLTESCEQATIKAAALGDMLELGDNSRALHRELGKLVGQLGYDYLAVTGEFSSCVADGAMEEGMKTESIAICSDKEQMAAWFAELIHHGSLPPGSRLLIKGSRGMRMELMLSRLVELTEPELVGS